jgi:peptidoglycan/LPS O-acetylase OafA/YrhL
MMTVSATRPAVATVADSAVGSRKAGFYRHDLDGLRGVAIALVAMFHVWFGRVSGGVDVFLALSGFFFGGKLLRAALNPVSSLSPLHAHHHQRAWPADRGGDRLVVRPAAARW